MPRSIGKGNEKKKNKEERERESTPVFVYCIDGSWSKLSILPSFLSIEQDGNDLYRRFKDFDWLYERLSERLPYMTIPSLPEKVTWNQRIVLYFYFNFNKYIHIVRCIYIYVCCFAVALGLTLFSVTQVGNKNEEGVVEIRRRLLESFLLRLYVLPEVSQDKSRDDKAFLFPPPTSACLHFQQTRPLTLFAMRRDRKLSLDLQVTRTEEFRAFVSPLQGNYERVRNGKKSRYILPPLNINSLSSESSGGRIASEAYLMECSKRLTSQV